MGHHAHGHNAQPALDAAHPDFMQLLPEHHALIGQAGVAYAAHMEVCFNVNAMHSPYMCFDRPWMYQMHPSSEPL